jgi:hypothetical protein
VLKLIEDEDGWVMPGCSQLRWRQSLAFLESERACVASSVWVPVIRQQIEIIQNV